MGGVGQGQDPAVRSVRRRCRRPPHRRRAARPPRAAPVRLPRAQPWPSVAARRVADGRLGTGRPRRGEKRAERAAVQAAARPGRRSSQGAAEIELLLPPATFVDVEAALEGAHRAESCIAEGRWAQAWGPAGIAYHVATRPFLTGLQAPWIDEWRRRLEEVRLRGLECFAAAGLGLGGPALAQAEERARMLTSLRPTARPGTASSWKPSSGAATSPKRFAPTSGYGSCCARNSGSRPAPTCRPSTDGCCADADG